MRVYFEQRIWQCYQILTALEVVANTNYEGGLFPSSSKYFQFPSTMYFSKILYSPCGKVLLKVTAKQIIAIISIIIINYM